MGSATDSLAENSFGGLLGWRSLFNLPRAVLADVLASFARALVPRGQVLIGTHVGDGDLRRTTGYGDIPVQWTTHLWQPDQLRELLAAAGLEPVVELRFPPKPYYRGQVVLAGRRP